ncbi:hypothetical protein [Flavobacterium sp. Root901]|uniref:DUF6630 family protein n=1 Tax=Flavobacterium sp. Root901 TaxID=1736605 RepID=UPI000FF898B4|nr:hypothetical protein [Flavobacterium sp. Root901]
MKNSIISLSILQLVYDKLAKISTIEITEENAPDGISLNAYKFPDLFLDSQNDTDQSGSSEMHNIRNEIYKKLNLNEKTDRLEYHFIRVQYYKKPDEYLKEYYSKINSNKASVYNFFIFFCKTNKSVEINDFRILQDFRYDFLYIQDLLDSAYLDLNEVDNSKLEVLAFVLEKICSFLQITIPENIELPTTILKQKREVELLQNFEEFLKLTTRGNISNKELKRQSRILFDYKIEAPFYDVLYDGDFDFLLDSTNYWHSDWKFDPEDAEYFISEIIGQELNFEYPEETYSHDLFPYIQSALGKLGLELMTYETGGDDYLFFAAHKEDVGRILKLSELIKIKIYQL